MIGEAQKLPAHFFSFLFVSNEQQFIKASHRLAPDSTILDEISAVKTCILFWHPVLF
jgi:hypothetical protein